MELNSSPSSISLSFNSYSDTPISHIARRVIQEFREKTDDGDGDGEVEEFDFAAEQEYSFDDQQRDGLDEDDSDGQQEQTEFEFHFQAAAQNPLKTADEIFQNGLIRPVYSFSDPAIESPAGHQNIRVSLRKLFMEDRVQIATPSSTSDEEDEELNGVPPESYCVWRPNAAAGVCKKSGSTGSSVSKKWKLRDILMNGRSRSDGGKGSLVFPAEGSDGKTAAYGGMKLKRRTTAIAGISVMPTV